MIRTTWFCWDMSSWSVWRVWSWSLLLILNFKSLSSNSCTSLKQNPEGLKVKRSWCSPGPGSGLCPWWWFASPGAESQSLLTVLRLMTVRGHIDLISYSLVHPQNFSLCGRWWWRRAAPQNCSLLKKQEVRHVLAASCHHGDGQTDSIGLQMLPLQKYLFTDCSDEGKLKSTCWQH